MNHARAYSSAPILLPILPWNLCQVWRSFAVVDDSSFAEARYGAPELKAAGLWDSKELSLVKEGRSMIGKQRFPFLPAIFYQPSALSA